MPEKVLKEKTVDKIIKYVNQKGDSNMPIELDDSEREYLSKINFSYEQRKRGYTRKDVVNQLISEFSVSLSTAYKIVRDTEIVIGPIGVSPKQFSRILAEEWCLKGIRMAMASKDLAAFDKFLGKYIKINGLDETEEASIPADALESKEIRLTLNPEDVGMKRIPISEIKEFFQKMTKEKAPKTIDITETQNG